MAQLKDRIAKKRQELEELEKQETEQLARERKAAKKREEKILLGLGYALQNRLKSATDNRKQEETLALILSLIKENFTEGKPDYQAQMKHIDHLKKILKPLPQETPDSGSVAVSSFDPQAIPVAASVSRQDGLAGANKGFAGA